MKQDLWKLFAIFQYLWIIFIRYLFQLKNVQYYENLQRRYFWILRNILRLYNFFLIYISYHVLEMYKSKVR